MLFGLTAADLLEFLSSPFPVDAEQWREHRYMHITDLQAGDVTVIRQIAAILVAEFATNWPAAWPDLLSATEEVHASFEEGHISRVALDEDDLVLGWVGGIRQYDGHVWELHPLVVAGGHHGRGVGRALVTDLEACVKERGGLTMLLGTDDENGQTSLANVNLFSHPCEHIAQLENRGRHPYEFYQKLGYVIVGVVPDANGLGKPDILMAKSLVR
jgi:aminoglycoside 6'-N-acetyltransferase I